MTAGIVTWDISTSAAGEQALLIGRDDRAAVATCALSVDGETELLLSLEQLRAIRDAAGVVLGTAQTSARDSETLDPALGDWPRVQNLACATGLLHGSIGATREPGRGKWYSPCRKLEGLTWWAVGPCGGWLVFPSFAALTEWASSRRGREWTLWGRP